MKKSRMFVVTVLILMVFGIIEGKIDRKAVQVCRESKYQDFVSYSYFIRSSKINRTLDLLLEDKCFVVAEKNEDRGAYVADILVSLNDYPLNDAGLFGFENVIRRCTAIFSEYSIYYSGIIGETNKIYLENIWLPKGEDLILKISYITACQPFSQDETKGLFITPPKVKSLSPFIKLTPIP